MITKEELTAKGLEFVFSKIDEDEWRNFLETSEVEEDAQEFRDKLLEVLDD